MVIVTNPESNLSFMKKVSSLTYCSFAEYLSVLDVRETDMWKTDSVVHDRDHTLKMIDDEL